MHSEPSRGARDAPRRFAFLPAPRPSIHPSMCIRLSLSLSLSRRSSFTPHIHMSEVNKVRKRRAFLFLAPVRPWVRRRPRRVGLAVGLGRSWFSPRRTTQTIFLHRPRLAVGGKHIRWTDGRTDGGMKVSEGGGENFLSENIALGCTWLRFPPDQILYRILHVYTQHVSPSVNCYKLHFHFPSPETRKLEGTPNTEESLLTELSSLHIDYFRRLRECIITFSHSTRIWILYQSIVSISALGE